jgi:hypothetical protein
MKFTLIVLLVLVAPAGCRTKPAQVPADKGMGASLTGNLKVTVAAHKDTIKFGDPIKVTYTVENDGEGPVIFFDRSFVHARISDGEPQLLFPMELLWRADWRECKGDYVTIEPHGKLAHAYTYGLSPVSASALPPFPWKVRVFFKVTRAAADNFYYDFEHEHIQATTKISIEAWTGTLSSNEVFVTVTGP